MFVDKMAVDEKKCILNECAVLQMAVDKMTIQNKCT